MAADISLFQGTAWYVVFLGSTTVHEAAHALVAWKLGDDTAQRGGQVTLDPTPHVRREPVGMVVVPLLSYLVGGWMVGWASAPYDPEWARRYPRRAGAMAMAGPVANLGLMLLAAVLIRVGVAAGLFQVSGFGGMDSVVVANREGLAHLAAVLLSCTFSLNVLLCVFNLIPLPPLDGSSGPLLLLSESAAAKYWSLVRSRGVALLGLFLAWKVCNAVFPGLFHLALRLLQPL